MSSTGTHLSMMVLPLPILNDCINVLAEMYLKFQKSWLNLMNKERNKIVKTTTERKMRHRLRKCLVRVFVDKR